MKIFFGIFCTLFFVGFIGAQKKIIKPEKIAPQILENIIQSKKYDLIGDFFVVKKKPYLRYAKVYKNNKWGYIDTLGNEVVEVKYISLSDFKNGICVASFSAQRKHPQTGNIYSASIAGLMNIEGEILTRKDYNYINFPKTDEQIKIFVDSKDPLLIVQAQNKYGLINKYGQEIIAAEFDEINIFKKIIAIQAGGKWAIVNSKFKQTTNFVYDYLFFHKNFLFGVKDKGRYIIDQEKGIQASDDKIDADYNISDWDNNESGGSDIERLILKIKNGEKYILADPKGKKIVEAKYLRKTNANYFSIRNGKYFGLINKNGKLVLDSIYQSTGAYEGGDAFFASLSEKENLIFDKKFKKIKLPNNDSAYRNGRITFSNEVRKWGIMDEKGRIIFHPSLDYIEPFNNYNFAVGKTEDFKKEGLINRNGKVLLPFIYYGIYNWGNKYNLLTKDNKYGFFNEKGEITIPVIYDKITIIPDENGVWNKLFIAKDKNISQLIDAHNKIIIANLQGGYSEAMQTLKHQRVVYPFSEKRIEEDQNEIEFFGVKDKSGKIIFPPKYGKIHDFHNGFACAEIGHFHRYGDRSLYLVDTYGNEILLRNLKRDEYVDSIDGCYDFK